MDRISLKNMVFFGYHGVLPAEQELGQRFMIDVCLYTDLAPAGKSDDLTQTVNYAEVYDVVKDITENRRFKLIEALAEEIAGHILDRFPVQQVAVTVRKPSAPVAGIFDYAEVSVTRAKS